MASARKSRAKDLGIPVVLFNRSQDDVEVSNVTSANRLGGRKVAEFLVAGGHERIAHIAGWQGSSTGRDRQAGFLEVLKAAGQSPFAIVDGMYKREVAMECARKLLGNAERPDAIFVGNDHMAFAVIDAIREAGLRPGHDISVVGFDDVPLASWGAYDLTTLRQPVERMVCPAR
ncbi:substrate-binding domain-containing protein [Albidovulum marisflavi]|uniref:substrate-binding domain-containing protein n=1 Tax=Albidovulum marisflavi TaxID=2984159 RepID=UPI00298122E4|nr:substrate-binding domain-containing protein [Defluviimonas sp. WL0002]